jgi:ketosteroid isomerase-like protein
MESVYLLMARYCGTMTQENVEIVRRILAANRSGPQKETTDIVLALAGPEVEFRSRITAVEGAEYLGHDGVRRYHDDMADAFRAWRNEADEIVEVSHGVVLVDNVFHGTGKDSGMEIELRSAIVFVVSEGRVTRCLSYPTREEALEAAGLSE